MCTLCYRNFAYRTDPLRFSVQRLVTSWVSPFQRARHVSFAPSRLFKTTRFVCLFRCSFSVYVSDGCHFVISVFSRHSASVCFVSVVKLPAVATQAALSLSLSQNKTVSLCYMQHVKINQRQQPTALPATTLPIVPLPQNIHATLSDAKCAPAVHFNMENTDNTDDTNTNQRATAARNVLPQQQPSDSALHRQDQPTSAFRDQQPTGRYKRENHRVHSRV